MNKSIEGVKIMVRPLDLRSFITVKVNVVGKGLFLWKAGIITWTRLIYAMQRATSIITRRKPFVVDVIFKSYPKERKNNAGTSI